MKDGKPRQYFEDLFFHDEKSYAQTLSTLCGSTNTHADCLSEFLLIVYRFRNNFFHGTKWAYDLKGQRDNFEHASQLLEGALDVVRELRSL